MNELQPLNQNVILNLDDDKTEQRTAGGLIIPDTAKEKPQLAKVVAVGNVENPGISVGDTVFLQKVLGHRTGIRGAQIPGYSLR